MISAIDHCSNLLLGDCHTAKEENEMKDAQLGAILDQLKSNIDAWDSEKCPPVRAHIMRMKGEEEIISPVAAELMEEQKPCSEVFDDFDVCTRLAYTEYIGALSPGADGRPDFLARKSCNYMTAAVEDCGNILAGHCNSVEEVTVIKDYQFQGILNQLASAVEEWDSEKCPAVKAHIQRQHAGDGGYDNADSAQQMLTALATVLDVLSVLGVH